jgi:ankyrin repeat protein
VEWRDPDGFSLLHLAALAGDPDMVNLLLSHKVAAPPLSSDCGK